MSKIFVNRFSDFPVLAKSERISILLSEITKIIWKLVILKHVIYKRDCKTADYTTAETNSGG